MLDGCQKLWLGDPGILVNVGYHSRCGIPPRKPSAVGKVKQVGKQLPCIDKTGTNIRLIFVPSSSRVEAAYVRFRLYKCLCLQMPVP